MGGVIDFLHMQRTGLNKNTCLKKREEKKIGKNKLAFSMLITCGSLGVSNGEVPLSMELWKQTREDWN